MALIIFKQKSGEKVAVKANNGESLMRAAMDNNIEGIKALCGGNCNCATCHVAIEPDFQTKVGVMSADEQQLLGKLRNKQPASRLACQIIVTTQLEGMRVIVK